MRRLLRLGGASLLAVSLLAACAGPGSGSAGDEEKRAFLTTYADIVFASYEDSLTEALKLQDALNTFVADPSPETMQAARTAWLAANEPYGQTEVYRFYGGPIDDADGPEALLNAWPLDEAYIDYVDGAPDAGIINNPTEFPTIDGDLLISLNEVGAEENISMGYHAIEFLLWGQDLSRDSAGERPHTDYVPEEEPNAERRAQYLTTASDLLVTHLEDLKNEWAPDGAGAYRTEFLALSPDEAIQKVLTGIGVLSKSELAGERMFTAYDNQDQEDEHSCFSDNTHRDIITNYQGIRNVFLGEYTRLDGSTVQGTGLAAVVATVDAELNTKVRDLLDKAQTEVNAIYVPFDQAIVLPDEQPKVLEAVYTLQDLGDATAEIAAALDLTINTALPE